LLSRSDRRTERKSLWVLVEWRGGTVSWKRFSELSLARSGTGKRAVRNFRGGDDGFQAAAPAGTTETELKQIPIIHFSSNCAMLLQSAAGAFRRKVSMRLRKSTVGPSLGRSSRHARKVISAASQSCAR